MTRLWISFNLVSAQVENRLFILDFIHISKRLKYFKYLRKSVEVSIHYEDVVIRQWRPFSSLARNIIMGNYNRKCDNMQCGHHPDAVLLANKAILREYLSDYYLRVMTM